MSHLVNVRRRLLIVLVIAAVSGLLVLSFNAGLASLYYFPAQFRVEQWEKSTDKPAVSDLQHATELVANAVRLQPDNPHYLLLSAKINEWRWYSGVLSSAEIKANEQLYQRAIALRPFWPVAYADYAYFLAVTQFRLTDAWQQLQLANQHGAFLPEVIDKYLLVTLSSWQLLSVSQKAQVFKIVETNFFSTRRPLLTRRIKQFGKENLFCLYLQTKLVSQPGWPSARPAVCRT